MRHSESEVFGRGLARTGDLRVAMLNVWARFGDWPARRAVLKEGLRALRPDLIGLQEAVTPRTRDFPCTTLVAEITAPEPIGPVLFVNHNPNFELPYERERELQAVLAARFMEQLVGERGLHVILTGDFDATPEQASIRFWCGRQSLEGMSVCYRNAWEVLHPDDSGHTFTGENPLVGSLTNQFVVDGEVPVEPGRRIDHSMVRCGRHAPSLHVVGCKRIFDEPIDGVWATDHFGVLADLAVPKPTRTS